MLFCECGSLASQLSATEKFGIGVYEQFMEAIIAAFIPSTGKTW